MAKHENKNTTKKRGTKAALAASFAALLLCGATLVGTTFAWFTDTATTGNNKIVAGDLELKVSAVNYESQDDYKELDSSPLFVDAATVAQNSTDTLWEPNKTQIVYFRVENTGNLAEKYNVYLKTTDKEDGDEVYLSDMMEYRIIPDASKDKKRIDANATWETIVADTNSFGDVVAKGSKLVSAEEIALGVNETHDFALAIHMKKEAGNDYKNQEVNFDLTFAATQDDVEADSFGTEYDKEAPLPISNPTAFSTALNTGGHVTFASDVAVPTQNGQSGKKTVLNSVAKDTVLDLSGNTLELSNSIDSITGIPVLLQVTQDAVLTITGDGVIDTEAGNNGVYGVDVNGGHVIVESGTIKGAPSAIQVTTGTLEIKGGFFDLSASCKASQSGSQQVKYLINCIDNNLTNGTAKISITGGTFVNFNPAESFGEPNAPVNFVADGYTVTSELHDNDTWYIVVKSN